MRFTKVIVAAAFVFTMTAGALLAADDSFSYGGYGRIGTGSYFSLNGPNGSFGDSKAGRLGAEGETNYFEQAFSKKWTADGGAWAKMTFTMGYFNGSNDGDESVLTWKLRQFYAEMGGLALLPAGATIWAGQRYYGRKDVHNFDLFYTNFSGIGFGVENLANGMFSIAYIGQGLGSNVSNASKVGNEYYLHNVVATIKVPSMATIDAGFGYAKGDKSGSAVDSKNGLILSALLTPPVMGLNVVGQVAKGVYAVSMATADYASMYNNLAGAITSATTNAKKVNSDLFYRVIAHTSTDVADGVTINPAVGFQVFDNKVNKDKTTLAYGAFRAIIKLHQNVAFQGNVGFTYTKHKLDDPTTPLVDEKKAHRQIQVVPAIVVALDPGYWTRPQIRFYGILVNRDSKNKLYNVKKADGSTSEMGWGCQMEAWW